MISIDDIDSEEEDDTSSLMTEVDGTPRQTKEKRKDDFHHMDKDVINQLNEMQLDLARNQREAREENLYSKGLDPQHINTILSTLPFFKILTPAFRHYIAEHAVVESFSRK